MISIYNYFYLINNALTKTSLLQKLSNKKKNIIIHNLNKK